MVANIKVVIYGDKFGLSHNPNNYLLDLTTGKRVRTSLWTNKKIILPISLDWQKGQHLLEIERRLFWPAGGRIVIAKSPVIKIEVVNRNLNKDGGWPAFLDQIKKLKPEVKKLNGF